MGGLGQRGRELLKEMERLGIILDVTHLCDESFWEVLDHFQGRIWVDDHDLQIVKTCGKNVPERAPSADQKKKKKKKKQISEQSVSPTVVTYREQIDGKYWLPTYVRSDETLHFIYGNDIHIREVIKYLRYKRAEMQAGSAVVQAQQP